VTPRSLARRPASARSGPLRRCLFVVLAAVVVGVISPDAQPLSRDAENASLEQIAPLVFGRMVGQERAQARFFQALAIRNGRLPERELRQQLSRRILDPVASAAEAPDAGLGFDVLGSRGSQLVRRAFAFERDVIAIYAGRSPADRRAALDAAVRQYQAGPGPVVADAAKDLSILYDHPYTSFVPPVPPEAEPHRELPYPSLTGTMWAARWYGLAVLTPLEDFPSGPDRDRALTTVADRLRAKLTFGATPALSPPTELPLTPAIAPGLVAADDRAAAIVDNLHMMLDILADVLARPALPNRRAALDAVVAQFSDRDYRCVQVDEWVVVALRHSIFAQGGPALAVMEVRERNAFSGVHGQHYGPRRPPPPCDPR